MNRKLIAIAAILIALQLYNSYKISNLQMDIEHLRQRQDQRLSELTNRVENIKGSIQAAIEEEASLLSSYALTYGETNWESYQRALDVSVFPKSFSENTSASFILDGISYPLTQGYGGFSATVWIPLFSKVENCHLLLERDSLQQVEKLNLYDKPFKGVIPWLDYYYGFGGYGGIHTQYSDNKPTQVFYEFDTNMLPEYKMANGNDFVSAKIVLSINDIRKSEAEISLQKRESNQQNRTLSVPIQSGDIISVTLEATDQKGLRYSLLLDQQQIYYSNSNESHNSSVETGQLTVHSPDGTLLYQDSVY